MFVTSDAELLPTEWLWEECGPAVCNLPSSAAVGLGEASSPLCKGCLLIDGDNPFDDLEGEPEGENVDIPCSSALPNREVADSDARLLALPNRDVADLDAWKEPHPFYDRIAVAGLSVMTDSSSSSSCGGVVPGTLGPGWGGVDVVETL